MLVVGGDQLRELRGPTFAQHSLHPGWVIALKSAIFSKKFINPTAIALEAAQHAIDQVGCPGLFDMACDFHRFTNCSVVGDACVQQLVEAEQQQSLHITVFGAQGFVQQAFGIGLQLRIKAAGAKTQFLQQCAVIVGYFCGNGG